MEAKTRAARWSVILGSSVAAAVAVVAGPIAAAADQVLSPERQAQFTARYQAALKDLWSGRPLQAVEPLQRLVSENGCAKHKCQLRLAQAHRHLGQLEEAHLWAEAAVERAARVGVTGAEEYNELGLCLFELSRVGRAELEQAVTALREAVARHTQQGDTYLYNLSQVLMAAGQTEEASDILASFQDAGSLRPIIEKGEAVIGEYSGLQVLERKYAKYTLEAKRQGTEGRILLRAVIDAEGRVADAEVVDGLPNGLNEAALEALHRSRFRPATLNGEPVAAIYHQSLDMKLTAALVSQHRIAGNEHKH